MPASCKAISCLQISILKLQFPMQLKNKVALRTNLEETLAAFASAHSVVLAGCVITAHCAQPLRAQWCSVGSTRSLVVHKVVAVGELERVRKSHSGLLSESRGAQSSRVV